MALECTIKQDTWETEGQKRSKVKFHVVRFPVICGGTPTPVPQVPKEDPKQFDDDSEDIPF